MPRVRFAPSPTGFLHIGSARTFIFNWLYARHNGGTMILRIDDTDVERNTRESETSIFEGLQWLELDWDEEYRQSERIELHREVAQAIFRKGLAYRDFTPAGAEEEKSRQEGAWLFNADMRELSSEESDRRAAAGEPFVLRFRVSRDTPRDIRFRDAVYGEQSKSTADIEDFALLRSNGLPTYHMASCADDIDLRNQPHHPRAGPPHQHLQARSDLRSRRRGDPRVRPPAAAHRPRRRQALQAAPRPGGQRHHLPRRRLPAPGIRQFPLPAGLVPQGRPRAGCRARS